MRLELHRLEGRLQRPLRSARGVHARRAALVVRLVDDDGFEGLGEASPLPGFSPDTLEQCAQAMASLDPRRLFPLDAGADLRASLGALLKAAGLGPPAARFALEIAALDLLGRREGLSVAALLGARADAVVRVAALLEPQADVVESARAAIDAGHRTLKHKLGTLGAFAGDERALTGLRGALGSAPRLRLDANGRLDAQALPARLDALARFGPELLEEPSTPEAMARLRGSPVPLALDESLASPGGLALAETLAARGALGALVIKPMIQGGVLASLALADRAASLGVPSVVTHTWDGVLGWRAAAALALALAPRSLDAGLGAHGALDALPGFHAECARGASFTLPREPGLGVLWTRP